MVLDWWGIIKADVGVRDGRIVALGRAGNADIADGLHPELPIGPATDVIAGEGKILTAGAMDSHVHLLSPSQLTRRWPPAPPRSSAAAPAPPRGRKATTVTPGAWHLEQMHRALDGVPLNVLLAR